MIAGCDSKHRLNQLEKAQENATVAILGMMVELKGGLNSAITKLTCHVRRHWITVFSEDHMLECISAQDL